MSAPADEQGAEGYEPGDVNVVGGAPAVDEGYEPGDVNTVPEEAGSEPDTANRAEGGAATAVLAYLARALADDADAVVVLPEDRRGSLVLRLHVAPDDMGRVIGRRGRTAQAIRTLVGVAGAREDVRTVVDIVDD